MPSKAMLNATATIAVAQGISEMIIDNYGMCIGMSEYSNLANVIKSAEVAYRFWPGDISGKGFKRLQKMVKRFELYVVESDSSLTSILSTGLALLESLSGKLSDRDRKRAVDALISALGDCYRDYDPDYEYEAGHITAALLENQWAKILEVA